MSNRHPSGRNGAQAPNPASDAAGASGPQTADNAGERNLDVSQRLPDRDASEGSAGPDASPLPPRPAGFDTGRQPGPEGLNPLEALEARLRAAREPYGLLEDPARLRYPALWQLLTVHHTTSGRTKIPASVSINASPTGFTVTLRDMTLSVALSVEVERLEDAFVTLERAIANPKAPWRDTRHGERARALKNQDAKNLAPWETKR